MVSLEKIDSDNIHAVLALQVADDQTATYPRSNAYSIAEGMFPPDGDPVWMRAICSDGVPVGFMMTSEVPERGEYFLWRMMLDERFQGLGYGAQAIAALLKRIGNTDNPRVLLLTHLRDNDRAGRFYSSVGFTYTNPELADDDLEMSYRFDR